MLDQVIKYWHEVNALVDKDFCAISASILMVPLKSNEVLQ